MVSILKRFHDCYMSFFLYNIIQAKSLGIKTGSIIYLSTKFAKRATFIKKRQFRSYQS